jgi:archaellum biogenesis protein FlaJ (TadC family)
MDLNRVSRGEYIAIVGGLLLLVGVFVKWYEAVSDLAVLDGVKGKGTYSAWDAHGIMRWLLILGALAPLVLAYIIARDHALSWPRGQVTSIIAITAIGLMGYVGLIDRPGEPSGQIELEYGWYVAMAGAILMLVGSVMRQQETEIKRKPPGTL